MATALEILSRVKGNEYYARAVQSDDFARVVELRAQAMRRQLSLPPVTWPAQPENADGIEAWLSDVADADSASRAREAKAGALSSLAVFCDKTIESTYSYSDRILESLAEDMRALMDEVGAVVDRLGDATTPREVIAASLGETWKDLFGLRDNYDKLRQAQGWVMDGYPDRLINCRSRYLDDPHASDLWIRNLDNVFSHWREPDRTVQHVWGEAPDPRPWPFDPIEQLAWLYNHAEVWVPTLRQLDELGAERHRRLNPLPPKHTRCLDPGWSPLADDDESDVRDNGVPDGEDELVASETGWGD